MKKVMFCANITENKKNDQTDEQPLVTKRLEEWQQKELSKTRENAEEFNKKTSLPTSLLFIKTGLLFFAYMIVLGIANSLVDGNSIEQAYHNAAFLFYILPIALIGWLVIFLYQKKLEKSVNVSPELEKIEKEVQNVITQSADELNIPEDVIEMDILAFRYKIKNDKIVLIANGLCTHFNLPMKFFVREDKLHIANIEQIVEIALKDFVSIERMSKNAIIPQWNKENLPKNDPYKKYKLKIHGYGMIIVKPYYQVSFNIDGQVYDLCIPVYEIAKFVQLTGFEYRDEFTS